MNILAQSIQSALNTIKSIPTVFRLGDEEFARGGGRVARILGGFAGAGDNAEVYSSNVWVYAAINAISRNIAGVPFVFQRTSGTIKEETPLTRLFEKPNQWQGYGQFMEALISWLHLNGEVVLAMRRNSETEVPDEMVALDATDFEPVLLQNGTLIGWTMTDGNGQKVPFRKHEIIFMRFWNPNDPIRGLSPIEAAKRGITQDLAADQFNTNFFTNSGAPSGVIEIEQNLTETEFERVVKQYEDKHGGTQNAHKMLILEGGAKFKPTVFTQKDMEFLNQKKWNRDATLAAFGVPKMEVGIIEEGANLAVIKMQSREFWLKNLIPKMELIEWHLWAQLFSKINKGVVWAEFDTSAIDALQDEFHEKVKTGRSLWEMGYTMNQINKRLNLGLPENSWQNFAFQPLQVQPVALDENGTPIIQDRKNPGSDPLQKPSVGEDTEPNEGEKVEVEPAKKPTPAEADDKGLELDKPGIALLSSKLKAFFFKQRIRQLKAFEKKKSAVLDNNVEKEALKQYLEKRGISIDCNELQELVNIKLLVTSIQNFNDRDGLANEIKNLYNKLDKAIPAMAEELYKRHKLQGVTVDAVGN